MIGQDAWLSDQENPFITSGFPKVNQSSYVSDFISNGSWDVEKVRGVFNEMDSRLILQFPLS